MGLDFDFPFWHQRPLYSDVLQRGRGLGARDGASAQRRRPEKKGPLWSRPGPGKQSTASNYLCRITILRFIQASALWFQRDILYPILLSVRTAMAN